ncbi:hypothetical protein Tsubulata_035188, partial [Turnera subulata]
GASSRQPSWVSSFPIVATPAVAAPPSSAGGGEPLDGSSDELQSERFEAAAAVLFSLKKKTVARATPSHTRCLPGRARAVSHMGLCIWTW